MLRRRTGPRQNARFGRPKPSSAILRPPTVPVDRAPKRSCRRGTPRWPRPESPRRVYGSRLLLGQKHLLFRYVLFTLHGRGLVRRSWHAIRRPSTRVSERQRKSQQCFNRPWALLVPLVPASQPVPALLRRGSPCGGSARTVARRFPGTELRSGEPSLCSAPRSTALRHFRHHFVITAGWVPTTSSGAVETFMTRRPIQPVPSPIDMCSAGASHTPDPPRGA
jgi:hypothetical protein